MEGAEKFTAKADLYVYAVTIGNIDDKLPEEGYFATFQEAYTKHKEFYSDRSRRPIGPINKYVIHKGTEYERNGVIIICDDANLYDCIFDIEHYGKNNQ